MALRQDSLVKNPADVWDNGALAALRERFQWLLHPPGLAAMSGEFGVGKNTVLLQLTQGFNPHRYQIIYLPETDFGPLDIYRAPLLTSTPEKKAPASAGAMPTATGSKQNVLINCTTAS